MFKQLRSCAYTYPCHRSCSKNISLVKPYINEIGTHVTLYVILQTGAYKNNVLKASSLKKGFQTVRTEQAQNLHKKEKERDRNLCA